MERSARRGFTIVEMMVVISILGVLIGLLLPAIARARDTARQIISQTNLHQLGQAHAIYAAEWNDRQFTLTDDGLSRYGSTPTAALNSYFNQTSQFHAGILLGWADINGSTGLWGFYFDNPVNHNLVQPIDFASGFGWFRLSNARQFNQYINARFYDPIFYAPKDRVPWAELEPFLETPAEYVPSSVTGQFIWSSYCLSAAALYSPDVFDADGFQDPWSLDGGFRAPSMSQARFADLKSHMLEHNWLQQSRSNCNPGFTDGTYDGCEPYYFNHGWDSVPMTLFYDGHVEGLGVRDAELADGRMSTQSGHGLWSRDTPFGGDGYFIELSFDFATTSFHILTTDGIRGRDRVGR
ncbi:MAG: type II secretion system protein [Planctomycetota bacterium]|jgi:prepilin-type N-terminal cleavage/methylation domain-containing protein